MAAAAPLKSIRPSASCAFLIFLLATLIFPGILFRWWPPAASVFVCTVMPTCHLSDFLCCYFEYFYTPLSAPSTSVASLVPPEEYPNSASKGSRVSWIPTLAGPAPTLHTLLRPYWPPCGSSAPPWMLCFRPQRVLFTSFPSQSSSGDPFAQHPPALQHVFPPLVSTRFLSRCCHFIVYLFALLCLCCLLHCNVGTAGFCPCWIPGTAHSRNNGYLLVESISLA